jgi:hypothetical protein
MVDIMKEMHKMQISTQAHIFYIGPTFSDGFIVTKYDSTTNILLNSTSNVDMVCSLFSTLVTSWNKIRLVYNLNYHKHDPYGTIHYHQVQCWFKLCKYSISLYCSIMLWFYWIISYYRSVYTTMNTVKLSHLSHYFTLLYRRQETCRRYNRVK